MIMNEVIKIHHVLKKEEVKRRVRGFTEQRIYSSRLRGKNWRSLNKKRSSVESEGRVKIDNVHCQAILKQSRKRVYRNRRIGS